MDTYQVVAVIEGTAYALSCTLPDRANPETFITAMTFFQTNEAGLLNPAGQWNTIGIDPAWDIGLFDGPLPPAGMPAWLNNLSDYSVNIGLHAGQERTFGFAVSGVAPNYFGFSLFFGGAQNPSPGTPAISVFAHSDDDGIGSPPAFPAIPAGTTTTGWPVTPVGAPGLRSHRSMVDGPPLIHRTMRLLPFFLSCWASLATARMKVMPGSAMADMPATCFRK